MKRKASKKLDLNRKTVRKLDGKGLDSVNGGLPEPTSACHTQGCVATLK